MSYEDDMRRAMEQAAAEQQVQPECPVDGEVDAAFGVTSKGKEPKPPKYKGGAMSKRPKPRLKNSSGHSYIAPASSRHVPNMLNRYTHRREPS